MSLRFLVVEGNVEGPRERHRATYGKTYAESYGAVLQSIEKRRDVSVEFRLRDGRIDVIEGHVKRRRRQRYAGFRVERGRQSRQDGQEENSQSSHRLSLYGGLVRAIYPTNGGPQGARRLVFAVGGAVSGSSGQWCLG